MDNEAEAQALAQVRARLQERFPSVDSTMIEAAVRSAHARMGGPIRELVPVLVEHAAHDRLAQIAPEQEVRPQVELD